MKKTRASALLLSFFMMTLLILVAIAVSVLVLHDVQTVRTLVGGTQAYYAAEGMSELGLHSIKVNLPGYEPSFGSEDDPYVLSSTSLAVADIHARESTVPCEDQSEDGWIALETGESIQLPLFSQISADGTIEEIDLFYVKFYVGDEDGNVSFAPSDDVLRWKILGMQNAVTEAVSEYIPLDTGNSRTTRDNPSIFGTSVDGSVPTGYTHAKYYNIGYPSQFYAYYPISLFLQGHSYNYLVLTNVVQRSSENTIYFQFVSEDYEAACEYAEIASEADTDFGSARQELVTLVKEGENLPVFDFVLYHTADDEEESESVLSITPVTSSSFAELFGN